MKYIKEANPYLIIIFVVLFIRTFLFSPILVEGESMFPVLKGNELMFLNKLDTNYNRFDIVVVNKSVEGNNLIKRIIGLPGETIAYKNEKLYVNGEVIVDDYAYGDTGDIKEITLGDDEYFVMGDNREVSLDSRLIGIIKEKELEGTVDFILFPFNRIGSVNK